MTKQTDLFYLRECVIRVREAPWTDTVFVTAHMHARIKDMVIPESGRAAPDVINVLRTNKRSGEVT